MDADDLRAMSRRCCDLLRVAKNDEVRAQLRQWVRDLDDEADMVENRRHWHAKEDAEYA